MAEALYTKYRPKSFKDIVGQEQVVKVLKGALKDKNVGHAYLFAGSRGLGKTSIARIFAHELGTADDDLYEIDAATHTQVERMRELGESVYTLPFRSPYKVYIIDEVHMLSKSAFNAFLKTLEEPPAHVIFILATTEADKLPETIVSRCQQLSFVRPLQKTLAKVVTDVATKEGYTLATGAAELIALIADGSFRDALSVLQKVLASASTKEISLKDIESITGSPRRELVFDYIKGIADNDAETSLKALKSADEEGMNMSTFLSLVLETLRSILLIRYAPAFEGELERRYGKEEVLKLKEYSVNTNITSQTLKKHLAATREMKFTPLPTLPLELAVFDLVRQDSGADSDI